MTVEVNLLKMLHRVHATVADDTVTHNDKEKQKNQKDAATFKQKTQRSDARYTTSGLSRLPTPPKLKDK